MIDRKHFKLRETTMYGGYVLKIRRGTATWITEICDRDNNYIAKTKLCTSRTEAANEAAIIISKMRSNHEH